MAHQFDFTQEQSPALKSMRSDVVEVPTPTGLKQCPQIVCTFRDNVAMNGAALTDLTDRYKSHAAYRVDEAAHTVTFTFSLKPDQLDIAADSLARVLMGKQWMDRNLLPFLVAKLVGKESIALEGSSVL